MLEGREWNEILRVDVPKHEDQTDLDGSERLFKRTFTAEELTTTARRGTTEFVIVILRPFDHK